MTCIDNSNALENKIISPKYNDNTLKKQDFRFKYKP